MKQEIIKDTNQIQKEIEKLNQELKIYEEEKITNEKEIYSLENENKQLRVELKTELKNDNIEDIDEIKKEYINIQEFFLIRLRKGKKCFTN